MTFRLAQFSDIHFSTKFTDEKYVHRDVRKMAVNDLHEVRGKLGGKIDGALVAGDLAYSGIRSEYIEAADWLEQVTDACGCPKMAVFPVPGNHDTDRKRLSASTKMLHKHLRGSALPVAMHDLVDLAQSDDGALVDKMADYQAFAASYGCNFTSPARPFWMRPVALADNRILNLVGLTTVQVCDADDDKNGMLLGRNQYILDEEPGVEHIVMMHHPFEWLKDRRDSEQYLSARARVLIFGHEHVQEIHKITSATNGDRLIISSGALTPENAAEPYIYRYNVLEFSIVEHSECPRLVVTVYPRVWVPEATRFKADSGRLNSSSAECARFELECPQFKRKPLVQVPAQAGTRDPLPGDALVDKETEEFSRLTYFFWRYLKWQDRLKLLVQADTLPRTPDAPLPQTVERLALQRARDEGKLEMLWHLIMELVPQEKRESNPFTRPTP